MDKPSSLHSLVLFVDEIDEATSFYSKLLSESAVKPNDRFAEITHPLFDIGFHPSDEKARTGLVVSYWKVESVDNSIKSAESFGFTLFRGPLIIGSMKIAQVRDMTGMVIGFIENHE